MTKDKGKKRNALGRGLSALLSDSETTSVLGTPAISENIREIRIDYIETNPYQPRNHFDLVALEELSESIKEHGIIQPITVRKMNDTSYQLIAGERRLQASKMAGLDSIPAYIRTANDEQMLFMALIENIQREDLNPMEIALGYQRMIDELAIKMEDLGNRVGKKRATVNNYLRLLKLPPTIQIALRDGKISMGHARALITVEKPDDQLALFEEAQNKDLSVRKVEELVRQLAERTQKTSTSTIEKKVENIHIRNVERNLEEKFGNKVSVKQTAGGKGELRIAFSSTEDLNRILDILDL